MGTEMTMEQVLEQMVNRLNSLESEVVRLRQEDDRKGAEIDDLKKQLDERQPTTEGEEGMSLMTTLKAFFEHKESKVWVPEPHDWEGD